MIDKKERFNRVYYFMKKDSYVASYTRLLQRMKKAKGYYSTNNDIIATKLCLSNAYDAAQEATYRVISQMEQGIITQTTKGIWLSYHKVFKRLPDLPDKSRQYIMTLETGEQFLVQRDYIPNHKGSAFLKNLEIIKKLN